MRLLISLCVLAGFATVAARAQSTLYTGATMITLAAGDDTPMRDAYLLVSGAGDIEAVGSGDPMTNPSVRAHHARPDWSAVSLAGKIVMPGFVSGHSHLWQSAFRGIAPGGETPPWLKALHGTYGAYLADGDFYAFTKHGALDQLRHGVTTTYNHSHFLGHSYDHYFEQWQAEDALPQHFVFAWVNENGLDDQQWEARLVDLKARLLPRPQDPFLGLSINAVGLYGHMDVLARELALARKLGLTVQMHYLEATSESEAGRARWSDMVKAGALGRDISFAHFIHVDEPLLLEAAKGGDAMIWNPLSNGRLGSGLPDIEHYLKVGLRVGMGEDGQASADISDPFENVRMGLYALRMRRENAGGLRPVDILRMHTLNTAEILGVDRYVGSLEPGKFADFLVIDPHEPDTGPVWDPVATVVFACSGENLAAVYVGGKQAVSGGQVVGFDAKALDNDVQIRIEKLRARAAAGKAQPH